MCKYGNECTGCAFNIEVRFFFLVVSYSSEVASYRTDAVTFRGRGASK